MQYRDISVLSFTDGADVVMASDMSASIGEKEGDQLYAPNEVVGAYAARVVIMELLCIGAEIVTLHYMVGGSYEDTVRPVVAGMERELALAGLHDVAINGSNEENMHTTSTSVGVTAIGRRERQPFPTIQQSVALYLVGKPLVGQAVLDQAEAMVTYEELRALLAYDGLEDVVPIGSRGVGHEVDLMVKASTGQWKCLDQCLPVSVWDASAGPATAVIAAIRKDRCDDFAQRFKKINQLGYIEV